MKFGAIFGFVCLTFLQAEITESSAVDKIIKEETVKYGELPYQVSLQIFSQHFCSGAIITNKYVLTAAHCMDNYKNTPSSIKVAAGYLKLRMPRLFRYVAKIILHDKFNRTTGENDIALLKVKNHFIFRKIINSIRLPKTDHNLSDNQSVIVSGWGRIYFNGYIPYNLQKVNLAIANHTYCKIIYKGDPKKLRTDVTNMMGLKNFTVNDSEKSELDANNGPYRVKDSHICAYDSNVKLGTCQFDSGAALADNGILVALVSWGNPLHCGGTDFPVVCTKVSYYVDWINKNSV